MSSVGVAMNLMAEVKSHLVVEADPSNLLSTIPFGSGFLTKHNTDQLSIIKLLLNKIVPFLTRVLKNLDNMFLTFSFFFFFASSCVSCERGGMDEGGTNPDGGGGGMAPGGGGIPPGGGGKFEGST